ncbi:alpha/beta hydrolase family protein [Phytoactinopolyspora endophytica]|uniref:alpha/beta hydrolase family protein n=1 Tax=Phytoactinopolyspora endophytica TaxID=1642495 RepID=UPI00197C9507|nr:alpha/beta fold hydrolase [Phytoactinopolyspora endophytica]
MRMCFHGVNAGIKTARARVAPAVAVAVLLVAGCTDSDSDTDPGADSGTATGPGEGQDAEGETNPPSSPGTPNPDSPGSSAPSSPDTSSSDGPEPDATEQTEPHPVSLPAMMEQEFDGRDLEVGDVIEDVGAYTRYEVTYRSGDLTISGIMNVPAGDGPFPVLILAHGYIDPEIYTTGRGLAREQDYLARQGYVVLHTDYRNYAGSDDDPENEVRLRLGYTEDVINAVLAVRESSLPYVDGDRVGLLGRSMGGGIALNTLVVEPGLVDAAVIYASVSSDTVDNFDRWTRGNPDAAELTEEIIDAYGSPEDNSQFWRDVSPVTFFDQVADPVLMHHGTDDDTCPIEWAHTTADALDDAGADVTLEVYEGEQHAFEPQWQDSIELTAEFFDEHL